MHDNLPEPLKELTQQLGKFPGVGPKSAFRFAMTLLQWPETETRRLGKNIYALRDNLRLCSRCGGFTSSDPCPYCQDEGRSRDVLCLVPDWDSLLAMETGGFFHGQYMILGGLLAPLQKRDSTSLDTTRLLNRLAEGEIQELILALGSTLEAENTVSYLKELIAPKFPQLSITRLAQGMPLGAQVRFMDRETLRQSLNYRHKL